MIKKFVVRDCHAKAITAIAYDANMSPNQKVHVENIFNFDPLRSSASTLRSATRFAKLRQGASRRYMASFGHFRDLSKAYVTD